MQVKCWNLLSIVSLHREFLCGLLNCLGMVISCDLWMCLLADIGCNMWKCLVRLGLWRHWHSENWNVYTVHIKRICCRSEGKAINHLPGGGPDKTVELSVHSHLSYEHIWYACVPVLIYSMLLGRQPGTDSNSQYGNESVYRRSTSGRPSRG